MAVVIRPAIVDVQNAHLRTVLEQFDAIHPDLLVPGEQIEPASKRMRLMVDFGGASNVELAASVRTFEAAVNAALPVPVAPVDDALPLAPAAHAPEPAWAVALAANLTANFNALTANVNALTANFNALSANVNALTANVNERFDRAETRFLNERRRRLTTATGLVERLMVERAGFATALGNVPPDAVMQALVDTDSFAKLTHAQIDALREHYGEETFGEHGHNPIAARQRAVRNFFTGI